MSNKKPKANSKNDKGVIYSIPDWIQSPIAFLSTIIALIFTASSLARIFFDGLLLQIAIFFALLGIVLVFLGIDYERQRFDHHLISRRAKNFVGELRFWIESKIGTKLEKIVTFISFGIFACIVMYFSRGFAIDIINLLWVSARDVVRLSLDEYPLSDHYLQSIGVVILFLTGINLIFIWIISDKLNSVYIETRNIEFWESSFSEYITKKIDKDWLKIWIWLAGIRDDFGRFYRSPYCPLVLRVQDAEGNITRHFSSSHSEEYCKKSFLLSLSEIENLKNEFCVKKYSCVNGIRKIELNVFTRRAEVILNENKLFFCSALNRYLAEEVFQFDIFFYNQNMVIQKVEVYPS